MTKATPKINKPAVARVAWRVCGILLSLLIVAVGVAFAVSCISIYRAGGSPFTRESIATHFDRIAVPVYICVAAVLLTGVLSLVLPLDIQCGKGDIAGSAPRIRPRRDRREAVEGLLRRVLGMLGKDSLADALAEDSPLSAELRRGIRRQRVARRAWRIATVAVTVLAFIPALVWCLDRSHFSIESLNDDILVAVSILLLGALVALAFGVLAVIFSDLSLDRETALWKVALVELFRAETSAEVARPAGAPEAPMDPPAAQGASRRAVLLWCIRGGILAVAVIFVVLGVLNGGMDDVLGKAIRICTECIGLG